MKNKFMVLGLLVMGIVVAQIGIAWPQEETDMGLHRAEARLTTPQQALVNDTLAMYDYDLRRWNGSIITSADPEEHELIYGCLTKVVRSVHIGTLQTTEAVAGKTRDCLQHVFRKRGTVWLIGRKTGEHIRDEYTRFTLASRPRPYRPAPWMFPDWYLYH